MDYREETDEGEGDDGEMETNERSEGDLKYPRPVPGRPGRKEQAVTGGGEVQSARRFS